MKLTVTILIFLNCILANAQLENNEQKEYIETIAQVDTLIAPDRIYMNIVISERDSKGKLSLETLDKQLDLTLKGLGIDTEKQLFLSDLSSRFQRFLLKEKDIYKRKEYSLIVYDASMASNVLEALERITISNVYLEKTEYSKMDQITLLLKTKSAEKAKQQAEAMIAPLDIDLGKAFFISDIENETSANKLQGRSSGILVRGMASANRKTAIYGNRATTMDIKKIHITATVKVQFYIGYNFK